MADLDIVTLEEAKARLGGSITRLTDDDEITADITALSAMFDDRFGAIVQRAVTDEEIAPNARCHGWTEFYPIVGDPSADTGTVEVVNRRFGYLKFSASDAAAVSYTAGRFADTGSVSELFKSAFLITLRNWRGGAYTAPNVQPGADFPTPTVSFPTFALPNASAQALAKYRRPEGIA